MNGTATIAWSLVLLGAAAFAFWVWHRHDAQVKRAAAGVSDLERQATAALESAAERLDVSEYDHAAANAALEILVSLAKGGDPEALLALPGVVGLVVRVANAAEAPVRSNPAPVESLEAARRSRRDRT